MIEVLRERSSHRIALLQNILESAQISTFIRNEHLSNVEISIPTFFPALCIMDEADLQQAQVIIGEFLKNEDQPASSDRPDLVCPSCQESSPATFTDCWNCSKSLLTAP